MGISEPFPKHYVGQLLQPLMPKRLKMEGLKKAIIQIESFLFFSSIVLFIGIAQSAKGQTFEKKFYGQWGNTAWTYAFHADGTYQRTSYGHFGKARFTGIYIIKGDTVHLLSGFENSSETLNEFYLLDKDSKLVDLTNFYDYSSLPSNSIHISQKRYDISKKTNWDSLIIVSKLQLDSITGDCIRLLKNTAIVDLKQEDHVQIIRLINTIKFDWDNLFKTAVYDEFQNVIRDKDYINQLAILYEWIPSRGMGYYFKSLNIELLGTPHLYSFFIVKNQ